MRHAHPAREKRDKREKRRRRVTPDDGVVRDLPEEALPVHVLLTIAEYAMVERIDAKALAAAELAEESERDIVRRIVATARDRLIGASA